MNSKKAVTAMLREAGITINGDAPWDIQIHDERLYKRVLTGGSLAVGESYMDGWWDAAHLDEFFTKLLYAQAERKVHPWRLRLYYFFARVINMQSAKRAFTVGEAHYDIGNDLYKRMLDARLVYTCGYWQDATTLEAAQEAKLDLICRKLNLQKGQKILDIGCGWGSFAKFAAEKYGVEVVGITISKEQAALARKNVAGLPVEIRLEDYRDTNGQFDHIVSIGMFEHVGYKNYRVYMEKVKQLLKPKGLFLLHTIGGNKSVYATDPWIHTYIFPNGMMPSVSQIGAAINDVFVLEDWHNFGTDYDTTLMEWFKNFDASWHEIKDSYNQRFYRMWKYYLLMSAASFRVRKNNLWQIVLSPQGVADGYRAVR